MQNKWNAVTSLTVCFIMTIAQLIDIENYHNTIPALNTINGTTLWYDALAIIIRIIIIIFTVCYAMFIELHWELL